MRNQRPQRRITTAAATVLLTAAVAALAIGQKQSPASEAHTLKPAGYIDLPGPPGKRFDYLTIDRQRHYLLSTHLAAGLLYIIDLRTNRLVKAIPDVPGIEGVEVVPDADKVYTSDWWENKIGIVDLKELKVVKKLPTESKPDGLAYATPFHKVYVSDERARAEAVVDTREECIAQMLHFDSETGNVHYDPVAKKILVNLQDKNVLAEIDPATDKEVARYPLGGMPGQSRHGARRRTSACLSLLRREQPDDRLRPGKTQAHRSPADGIRRGRNCLRSRPEAHLRCLFQRSDFGFPAGRPRSLPQTGGLSRSEESPLLDRGCRDTSDLRP